MSYHHPIICILIHPTALTTEITNQLTEFLYIVSVLRFAILKIIFNFVFVNIINS